MNKHLPSNMAAVTVSLTLSAAMHAGEIDTPLAKLPEPVQKTILTTVSNGKISKTVKEIEDDGTVIYEVSYTVGKRKFEAEVSAKGKLIVVDEQIVLSEAPEAVQKVIKEKTAGGKIGKVEKATKGKTVFYEAEFTKDGKEHEVQVAPGGKVLKVE